LTLKNHVR